MPQIVIGLFVLVLLAAGAVTMLSTLEQNQTDPQAVKQEAAERASRRAPSRDTRLWDLKALPRVGKPLRDWVTDDGVRVFVMEEGKGEPVNLGRPIDVSYTGWFLDGTRFDQGVLKGLTYGQLGAVVPGFMEGLKDIKPYERRRILIPSEQGYAEVQRGDIPPHTDLVFDIRWVYFKITVIDEGAGKAAKLGSRVTVHYTGRLEDGTIFETSKGKEPISFDLRKGGLIDGWIYGLKGMKEGGRRRLWIPSHLAYADSPRRGSPIKPWDNLIFEIELIKVE